MKEKEPFNLTLLILSTINMFYSILNLNLIFKMQSITLFLIFIFIFIRKKNKFNIIIKSFIIIFLLLNIIYSCNIFSKNIKEDFTNKSYSEVYKYAKKNKINLKTTYEYSDEVKKNKIINYDVINNKNLISILISNGSNYDKKIILPNMEEWTLKKVTDYLIETNLTNVDVNFVNSTGCKENTLISQSITGTMKRSDKLNLTFCMSKNLKKFNIKDLTNKNKIETIIYLKSNDINYEIKEVFNKVIEKNKIIKSDKNVGDELIPHKSKVVLYISLGTEIIIPDLNKMNEDEIYNWILKNNINAEFKNIYDTKKSKGEFIKASYNKGDKISEKDKLILYFSKGKLTLPNFTKLNEFTSWAKRNTINYEIKYEENENIEAGNIIKFSVKAGSKITSDKKIIVYIATNNKVFLPSFINQNIQEIKQECNKLELKCYFKYQNDNQKEGTCINQYPKGNQKILKNSIVTITIASKNVMKKEYNKSKENNTENKIKESNTENSIIDLFGIN